MITRGLANMTSVLGRRGRGPGPEAKWEGPRLPPGRRIYAIGDVHGQLAPLQVLHGLIRADLQDRPVARPVLVHLGDLIDRGPDSAGVVELLAQGSPAGGVPTVNLMGNHEWMFLLALARRGPGDADHWLDNGGEATLASWGIRASTPPERWPGLIPRAHVRFLQGLAGRWGAGAYVFAHAGVRPGRPLDEQVWGDLLWIRAPFLDQPGPLLPDAPGAVVVHGHTPQTEPSAGPHRIGVDTGAGRGGPLTCAVLEGDEVRFLQAPPMSKGDGRLATIAGLR